MGGDRGVADAAGDGSGSDAAGDGIDKTNRVRPALSTPTLEAHARSLLEAVANDDPELARDFFFPREPFKPLKDVADPDRYWRQLFGAFKRDIHELHLKRKNWAGARFDAISLGTAPTWVRAGDEYNKIGYYRTFHARLRYRMGEKTDAVDVHTIISWQGEWYITHLSPVNK